MIANSIKFYLVRDYKAGSLQNDFNKIIDYLGSYNDLLSLKKESASKVIIAYNDSPYTATLITGSDPTKKETVQSNQITLTCNQSDNNSVNLVKSIASSIGYRIWNPIINGFCANDPNLVDLTTVQLEAKIYNIFKLKRMVPIYQYRSALVFYALDPKDKSVHLINRHLLQAMLYSKKDISAAKDFNVKVAEDITTFVALSDRGIMPNNFYHTLYKKDKGKVLHVNLSYFDIDKVNSDAYLAPIFFHLDRNKQKFISLGHIRAIDIHEIILKGVSIKKTIDGWVKKFKIEPLIAVKYPADIDFVIEKNGKVVPRFNISVFVDQQK
ncbi:hypothetical protein A2W32_01800 [candidate division WWE3 bacterium RBG_16_37_10]|uniref:Uncharacterized protein n=1 Tax=candidate division WWE3 bacterium RBG_16_37_10 TaxID=1802610 RepID=A0A1F4UWB5_UNCKA|nr:MAG: hypothetical protein A2W32_01800 [candidate division WWE3 bacterium RBG_16_37_10]